MKLVIVIQAEVASTWLPGKVLKPIVGRPLLYRMIERVRSITTPAQIVVATTHRPKDDAIERIAADAGVACFRGHPTDLLNRHVRAGRTLQADAVVKIGSDCPLIDPATIDRVLAAFLAGPDSLDYASNLHPASYPAGNDVEVVTMRALESAELESRRPYERSHTTPFIWDQPERFPCRNVAWETGLDYSTSHRFTVEYPEDYSFVRAVYEELWSPSGAAFSIGQILELLAEKPFIQAHNAKYRSVNWHRHSVAGFRMPWVNEPRLAWDIAH